MPSIILNKSNRNMWKKAFYAFAIIIFFNAKISLKELGIVSDQLTISINHQYPPFYAFEEIQYKKEITNETIDEKETDSNTYQLSKNSTENVKSNVTTVVAKNIELNEIVIDSAENNFANSDSIKVDSTQVIVSQNQESDLPNSESKENDLSWINTLSSSQKLRLELAQNAHKILNKHWDVPSSEDLFRDKIEEIKIKNGLDKVRNEPSNETSSVAQTSIGVASASMVKNRKFNGLIEFSEGLAFTNDFAIEVRRQKEGVPLEAAEVNLREATFSISLKDNQGLIVAEVINSKGIIEGQGTLSIEDLVKPKNGLPRLIVKPVRNSLKGKLLSASGKFKRNKDNNLGVTVVGSDLSAKTSQDGKYIIDSIATNSDVVLEARVEAHQPMITTISLSESADIMLLPNYLIKGLTEVLRDQEIPLNLDKGDSLIWGLVTENGKPIEGAIVILDSGVSPVYFGDLQLPDKTMYKTSSNGMFAFVNPKPGWNEVEVQTIDKRKSRWNVLTFPGKISQLNAAVPMDDHVIAVRTFDAFTGEPVQADVTFQQLDEEVDTGVAGIAGVNLPKTNNISMVEVKPGEPYIASRQMYSVLLDHLHIPLVSEQWVKSVRSSSKISEIPDTTTVIGFVNNADFEIINSESNGGPESRVYFNSKGQPVKEGVAGGGFVLFNQPQYPNSISIYSKTSNKTLNKIIIPAERFMNVISAQF